MNDQRSFERFVADNVAGQTQGTPLPDDFYDDMHSFATTTRQRPEWLALIKEPTMRTNSHLAVGSPTARAAAILVATMLLALALGAVGLAGERLLAAADPIVVAQDGSGDYTTIADGVAAAEDGDEVVVRPGTYVESVLIDKDITLRGDGDTADIVLQVPEEGPRVAWPGFELSYALYLQGSDAAIRDLTISAPARSTSAIIVRGGSPSISGTVVDAEPSDAQSARGFVYAGGGSTPRIVDNVTDAFIWIDEGADATISDNRRIEGGSNELGVRVDGIGSHATVTGNELGSSTVGDDASATFADNRFDGLSQSPWDTCLLDVVSTDGEVTVKDNRFEGGTQGICTIDAGAVEIVSNTFTDAEMASVSLSGGQAQLGGNTVHGSTVAVSLSGGTAVLEDNTLEDNGVGLLFLDAATPSLKGNTVCGNETNVMADGVEIADLGGNEICSD